MREVERIGNCRPIKFIYGTRGAWPHETQTCKLNPEWEPWAQEFINALEAELSAYRKHYGELTQAAIDNAEKVYK